MTVSARGLAAISALIHMRQPKSGTESRRFRHILRQGAAFMEKAGNYRDMEETEQYELQDADQDLIRQLLGEVYEGKTKIYTGGNAEGFFNEGLGEVDELVAKK